MANVRPYKVFLDTSVLLSGLNSPAGASGVILSLFKIRHVTIAVSPEVLLEAQIVIKRKFSRLMPGFLDFLSSNPIVTAPVTLRDIRAARAVIDSEDTPIFAGARKSGAEFLLTLDKKFQRIASRMPRIKVLSPGEFLARYRAENRK